MNKRLDDKTKKKNLSPSSELQKLISSMENIVHITGTLLSAELLHTIDT